MARYRAALIGLGRIASTIDDEVQGNPAVMLPYAHMACYREVPSVEVVAASDTYAEQREAFGQRWGVDRLYVDYREMLERERPDIVSVATSAAPRPGIVMDCAKAGVRVIYAEKPIAFSLAEADEMISTCHEYGAKLAIGCTRRWDANWNQARAIINDGGIGPVLQVNGFGRAGISHNGRQVRFSVVDREHGVETVVPKLALVERRILTIDYFVVIGAADATGPDDRRAKYLRRLLTHRYSSTNQICRATRTWNRRRSDPGGR